MSTTVVFLGGKRELVGGHRDGFSGSWFHGHVFLVSDSHSLVSVLPEENRLRFSGRFRIQRFRLDSGYMFTRLARSSCFTHFLRESGCGCWILWEMISESVSVFSAMLGSTAGTCVASDHGAF